MASPLKAKLTLDFPPIPGQAVSSLPFLFTASYTNEAKEVLNLSTPGTTTLSLGAMAPAGAQFSALLITQDALTDAEDVSIEFNDATAGAFVVPPGGFVFIGGPTGQDTPSIKVTNSVAAIVRVFAFGA